MHPSPPVGAQARYYRSFKIWKVLGKPVNINPICHRYFNACLKRNMAIVSMDVRGSGASFGTNE